MLLLYSSVCFFCFKQKTAYELRISDWSSDVCSSDLLIGDDTPASAVFQFPGGLADHLKEQIGTRECVTAEFFAGRQDFPDGQGSVEWAVAWPLYGEGSTSFYFNTIPTPDGGTHETGLPGALPKGISGFGALVGHQTANGIQPKAPFPHPELMP